MPDNGFCPLSRDGSTLLAAESIQLTKTDLIDMARSPEICVSRVLEPNLIVPIHQALFHIPANLNLCCLNL